MNKVSQVVVTLDSVWTDKPSNIQFVEENIYKNILKSAVTSVVVLSLKLLNIIFVLVLKAVLKCLLLA